MSRESQASLSGVSGARWIAEARNGSRPALNRLFEACSSYLLAVAKRELCAALRSRLDPVDVVQDTLMKAWRHFPHFRGQTEADFLAWLRQILRCNLFNERRRHLRTAMRSARREVPLAAAASMPQPDSFRSQSESPGTQAQAREQHEALERGLRLLPARYRQVLHLHAQEGLAFAQVGQRLDRSAEAARKLWVRAVKELAWLLSDAQKT
jgi:RNA polymerase sigma-70 factor (ECF subfamily)